MTPVEEHIEEIEAYLVAIKLLARAMRSPFNGMSIDIACGHAKAAGTALLQSAAMRELAVALAEEG